jgi:hypothetical protein
LSAAWAAVDLLKALIKADPQSRPLLLPIINLLIDAGRNSVAVHAAVVAEINEVITH